MALRDWVHRPTLDTEVQRNIEAWQALPQPDLRSPSPSVRWVVVDTETSGLNPGDDRLLALGAVAIENGRIALEHSFEAGLAQTDPSETANILIHGIGEEAQCGGLPPAEALGAFLEFAKKHILIGFHAPFDAAFLRHAMRTFLGIRFTPIWLDAETLARALFPEAPSRGWGLDEWLRHLGIHVSGRHSALADAFSTAQLFLAVLARASQRGEPNPRALIKLEHATRALARFS
jgi:DNA polymerase-3 subunit epsilon